MIWTVPARIVRVVDGDTLHCDLTLGHAPYARVPADWDLGWGVHLQPGGEMRLINEPVRLARINAAELGTPEGETAAAFLAAALAQPIAAGTTCTFSSTGFDRYRRALGELVVPSIGNVSDYMLSAGHAVPYAREQAERLLRVCPALLDPKPSALER